MHSPSKHWKCRLLHCFQDAPVGEAACLDSWTRCLESVRELISEAESVFNREASSQVCREALDTAEGTAYMQSEPLISSVLFVR